MRSTAAGKETEIATNESPGRSTLSSRQARQRYVEIAELAVLEQIQRDAETLDRESIAVGPFVRLDSNAVAAKDGKTRGTISNLFGSQSAFQAETMALALSARDWIAHIEYPSPGDYPTADAWVDAFFAAESARGPHRGLDPRVSYAFLWSIWLSLVPYGLWSERIRQPSMEEHVQWLDRLEEVLRDALEHFGLVVRDGHGQRSRGGHREPRRGRLAEPVPDRSTPIRPVRADLDAAAPLRAHAVARRDRAA